MMPQRVREQIGAIYRSDSRRVLATLIRLLGDFDRAEEAMSRRLHGRARRLAAGRAARQRPRVACLDRTVQGDRSPATERAIRRGAGRAGRADRSERAARAGRSRGGGWRGGRPPSTHLHVLPSGAQRRRPHRAHAARGVRPRNRADRPRVPDGSADAGPAHRARQGQDPRRAYPVSGAGSRRAARSPRRRASRRLSRLQRGLFRVGRRRVDAARPVRRGDPPRAAVDRAPARAGSPRPARVDAAARCATGRADIPGRRDRPPRCTGSVALGPRADRRGPRPRSTARSSLRRHGPLHAAGGDRGCPRRGARQPVDGLAPDRRSLRRAFAK